MIELLTECSLMCRAILAFFIAFGISLLAGDKMILKLISMKLGQPVRSREEVSKLFDLHGAKAGTPTMGGVMILATLLIALLLCGDLTNSYLHVSCFVLLSLGALGFKDDFAKISQGNSKGVSSKFKLVWQFGVAAIASVWIFLTSPEGVDMGSLHIPLCDCTIPLGYAIIGFWIVVIIGASNAVNLTDGLDGLASGCIITTGLAYAVIALISGLSIGETVDLSLQEFEVKGAELAVFAMALVGASTGFLWFNVYPARVFMGDTGSLAIGGGIGVMAICLRQEVLLVLIGLIFVAEACSVMLQVGYFKVTKKRSGEGKRLFRCAPLHHHFELGGLKEMQVIGRFWIISAICAALGVVIALS